jgi:hypothetical protein
VWLGRESFAVLPRPKLIWQICASQVWVAFSSLMLTISSLLLGATGLFLLSSNLSASTAGFTLAFAVDLSLQLFWLLDRIVNLEEQMVSVERMNESTSDCPSATGVAIDVMNGNAQSLRSYQKTKERKTSRYRRPGHVQAVSW